MDHVWQSAKVVLMVRRKWKTLFKARIASKDNDNRLVSQAELIHFDFPNPGETIISRFFKILIY